MISTKFMKKLFSYNYFGVTEAAFKKGKFYYLSIIDHRQTDTKLDGIYMPLGVHRVDRTAIDKWAKCRGLNGGVK